jgi:hypothetical protein
MSKLLSLLIKVVADKQFSFKIDSDGDGKPFVEGHINLAELIDEAAKYRQ